MIALSARAAFGTLRRRRILALAALMAAYLPMLPYAATHLDLARDV